MQKTKSIQPLEHYAQQDDKSRYSCIPLSSAEQLRFNEEWKQQTCLDHALKYAPKQCTMTKSDLLKKLRRLHKNATK